MSNLLDSGIVGVLDKNRNSVSHIYDRWKHIGYLDGLDFELAVKVSVSFEAAAHILLMKDKISDIHYKYTGEIMDDDSEISHRITIVLFPLIRRVIQMLPEADKYIPEIVTMVKKEYNTSLCKYLYAENENFIAYFYENLSIKWNFKDRKHEKYKDFKKDAYEKYFTKSNANNNYLIKSYEEFIPMDIEAEFHVYVANKIEQTIRKHIKK